MSKSRIEARFAQLKAENRAAFVAYVMAGDPDYATGLEILQGLPAEGYFAAAETAGLSHASLRAAYPLGKQAAA